MARRMYLAVIFVFIFLIAASSGISYAIVSSRQTYLMFIPPLIVLCFVLFMIIYVIINNRRALTAQKKAKAEIINFLATENHTRYFPRGVQFLLKENPQIVANGRYA